MEVFLRACVRAWGCVRACVRAWVGGCVGGWVGVCVCVSLPVALLLHFRSLRRIADARLMHNDP